MPRQRRTLNALERKEYQEKQARLRAGGAELDISSFEIAVSKWVRVIFCRQHSFLRMWPGASVFGIHLRIIGLAPKTIFDAFELSTPDWNWDVDVVDDPMIRNPKQQCYGLLRDASFHRSEVLNHHLEREYALPRGDMIKGWLLAQSFSAPPPQYNKRCPMPLALAITNQFGNTYEINFQLPVERLSKPHHTRTGSLYGPLQGPVNINDLLSRGPYAKDSILRT